MKGKMKFKNSPQCDEVSQMDEGRGIKWTSQDVWSLLCGRVVGHRLDCFEIKSTTGKSRAAGVRCAKRIT